MYVLFAFFCFHVVHSLFELIQNFIFISFWYQKALLHITAFFYGFFLLAVFFSLSFFNLSTIIFLLFLLTFFIILKNKWTTAVRHISNQSESNN